MTLQDSFILAWRTVKSNKLRTGITVAIIAFGIMALIGIITAISAMNQSLKENFSFIGEEIEPTTLLQTYDLQVLITILH